MQSMICTTSFSCATRLRCRSLAVHSLDEANCTPVVIMLVCDGAIIVNGCAFAPMFSLIRPAEN